MKCINWKRINQANDINNSDTDDGSNSSDSVEVGFDLDEGSDSEFALL